MDCMSGRVTKPLMWRVIEDVWAAVVAGGIRV